MEKHYRFKMFSSPCPFYTMAKQMNKNQNNILLPPRTTAETQKWWRWNKYFILVLSLILVLQLNLQLLKIVCLLFRLLESGQWFFNILSRDVTLLWWDGSSQPFYSQLFFNYCPRLPLPARKPGDGAVYIFTSVSSISLRLCLFSCDYWDA